MKIILVATDSLGKSLGFVSDSMKVLSLAELFPLVSSGRIEGVHIVQSRHGNYIRSAANSTQKDNLDAISISGRDIIFYANQTSHAVSTPAITNYLQLYLASIQEGGPFLIPSKGKEVLVADIKEKFIPHISLINTAAKEFAIDKYLLGAIIIDELARIHPFEPIINLLESKIVGLNVSVGIAQVKIDTANQLIKKGLYNPNPADKKLPFYGTFSNAGRIHLYEYLIQPKHNIHFAAARMRDLVDEWMRFVDISQRPEIIATLYHLPYRKPHSKPEPNKRGDQIASEFYKLSKKWLA
jgi:hypothetical protein